jgi:hypothetical protein
MINSKHSTLQSQWTPLWTHKEDEYTFDTPLDFLLQKKKNAGRHYYHPAPTSTAPTKSTQFVISGWLNYPEEAMVSLPGKEEQAMRLKYVTHHRKLVPPPDLPATLQGQPPTTRVKELEKKVKFLESQLHCDRPYLQLYRLGAGGFLAAIISLVMWVAAGVGIPFHPIFAAGVIPLSIAIIVMAFLIRPPSPEKS